MQGNCCILITPFDQLVFGKPTSGHFLISGEFTFSSISFEVIISAPFLWLMASFAVIEYAVDVEEIHLTLVNGSGLLTGQQSLAKHDRIIPPPPLNINQVFRVNSRGVFVIFSAPSLCDPSLQKPAVITFPDLAERGQGREKEAKEEREAKEVRKRAIEGTEH